MFCSLRSFREKPCASSASCCLRGCCLFGYCFTNKRFTTMGKRVFSDLWLQKPLYKEWLREVKGDKHKARCIVCMKDVDISSMGESAHTSYMNSCLSLDFAVRGVLEKWKMCP